MSAGRVDRRQVVKALALGVPAAGWAAGRIDHPATGGPCRRQAIDDDRSGRLGGG